MTAPRSHRQANKAPSKARTAANPGAPDDAARPDSKTSGNASLSGNQSNAEPENSPQSKAGLVAILGRPNVGKSTLLNALLGAKLAAVSPKPQTSRHRLLGVLHGQGFQIGLLDTPGWLESPRVDELGQRMAREVREALDAADLVLLMAVPRLPGAVEQQLAALIKESGAPALAAINKVDTVKKSAVLPVIAAFHQMDAFREIIPVSVRAEDGLGLLLERIVANLPEREPLFDPDQLTDRSERFLVAELIREKVFALYGEEVPYAAAVRVESFREGSEEHGGKDYIEAVVYVDRPSQKAILVGKGGAALKEVGVAARPEIEALLGRPVFLQLWVKTQPHWRRDPRFLKSLEQQ